MIHKLPIAKFFATPNIGPAPLTVNFQNQSLYANHPADPYDWLFEDTGDSTGPSSNETNPQHTYDTPGTYQVTLLARNASNYNNIVSNTVTVLEPVEEETTEDPVSVQLEANPPQTTEGNIPYVGYTFPRYDQFLKRIENPSSYTLRFIKPGYMSGDCNDPEAVVVLPPGGQITSTGLEEIYGISEPPGANQSPQGDYFGLFYNACIEETPYGSPQYVYITAVFDDIV